MFLHLWICRGRRRYRDSTTSHRAPAVLLLRTFSWIIHWKARSRTRLTPYADCWQKRPAPGKILLAPHRKPQCRSAGDLVLKLWGQIDAEKKFNVPRNFYLFWGRGGTNFFRKINVKSFNDCIVSYILEDAPLQTLLSVTPSSVFCRACEVTCHNRTR